MRRLSELLPEAVAALGIAGELADASHDRAWDSVVAEVVPAAAGRCQLVTAGRSELVVQAADAATAQELRLHGGPLLDAFGSHLGGERPSELRVVVRPV